MKRRVLFVCLLIMVLSFRVSAEPIKRVNFAVPYDSLQYALGTPIVAVESGVVKALGWNRYGG